MLSSSIVFLRRENASNPDFIQNCNDYAVLGRSNKELLLAIGYDLANLERIAELSKILADLYAQVTLDRSTSPELTTLCTPQQ